MKNLLKALCILTILLTSSCISHTPVLFSNESWSYSAVSGEIANSDSTLRFFLGDNSLDPDMTIIGCRDSLTAHKGTSKYIGRILKVCGLQNSTVYFFAPAEHIMWVELPKDYRDVQPAAVSFNLEEDNPVTSWIWEENIPEGNRKADQIYSNTYADKRNKTLIVVDKLHYGNKPMACLHIFQSETPKTSAMGFQPWYWTCKGNLIDHTYDEILANWIDTRRRTLFINYRLGQRPYPRNH